MTTTIQGDLVSMGKDGTNVREMVAQWLRANHYDGLCNPDGECGCGLDDLMPCQCVNGLECVCAYEAPAEDSGYDRMFCISDSWQDEPSDSVERIAVGMLREMRAMRECKAGRMIVSPASVEGYANRLKALGVVL